MTVSIGAMSPEPAPQPDWDPDDPRVLFRRIVDDILDQIEQGTLYPNAPLPSARKMADIYGVGVMTVQRALRELQQLRVTYSIAGKGTFVHPDIADLRDDAPIRKTLSDPGHIRRLVAYLNAEARQCSVTGNPARHFRNQFLCDRCFDSETFAAHSQGASRSNRKCFEHPWITYTPGRPCVTDLSIQSLRL